MLEQLWAALGGEPGVRVEVDGPVPLPSVYAVDRLAAAAVGAQLLAASALRGDRAADAVRLDGAHLALAFTSERHVRPTGLTMAPLSTFLPAADGWVRLHANYAHHAEALSRALGRDVPAAVAARGAAQVEDDVVAAGGVAAQVRTEEQWRAHPQAQAVAGSAPLRLARLADAPPRPARLRVLDLTRVIAGPVGGRTLASHGADVLRVDLPHRPEDEASLRDTGSGKRQVALDLRDRTDRTRLEELLAGADVLLSGYRPGALDRFGLGSQDLAARHPHVVAVRLSAWGTTGPWAQRRGFDSIVQAACGIAATTSAPDGRPGVLPAQALDHAAGHLVAACALRGLAERERGGTWAAELSLLRLAHLLLDGPRGVPVQAEPPDPAPHLLDLGGVTVVAPPGSAPWTAPLQRVDRTAGWR